MTNVSELVGSEREVTISGKTLKLRQLKIKELFVYFENKAVEAKIKEARMIADVLGGDEKISFMMKVWGSLPKGAALTDLATEAMTTLSGVCDMFYMSAKDLNPGLTEKDIKDLIGIDSINDLGSVVAWISGFEGLDPSVAVEEGDKKK